MSFLRELFLLVVSGFKIKCGSDGKIKTFKVLLVVKCYIQKPSINFEESFSPVALLAITKVHDYEI